MSVACTLKQVFWKPENVQVYMLYRCFLDINVHMCVTHSLQGCTYMRMHIYVYMHAYVYGCVCASMIFLDALKRHC